jgi:hypothetical protein
MQPDHPRRSSDAGEETGRPADGRGRRSAIRLRLASKASAIRLAVLFAMMGLALVVLYRLMIPMPGDRYDGPLPEPTMAQSTTAERLEADVVLLAATIGHRNVGSITRLHQAEHWLLEQLGGLDYEVTRQEYAVTLPQYHVHNAPCANVIAERGGSDLADEIVVIGAHYDSVIGSPGANDNASGVAAMLELARRLAEFQPRRTLRFVAFVNEEPPFFQTERMGSWVYAKACHQRNENIVGMISLETIGYYSDEPGSQQYPAPFSRFYPDRGDFIGFVSNIRSRALLREVVATFREHAELPSEGAALFGGIAGVGWSDHWAFWQEGYPGLMVTDTAPFRYPHYHMPSDTPDKLDYERMARVVDGMEHVVRALAHPPR